MLIILIIKDFYLCFSSQYLFRKMINPYDSTCLLGLSMHHCISTCQNILHVMSQHQMYKTSGKVFL